MDIIELKRDNANLWNDFCLRSHYTWFWHTTDWIDYTLQYQPELKSKNISFLIIQNNKVIGLCPLLLEYNNDFSCNEFSFGGGSNPNPAFAPELTNNQRLNVEKLIFRYIDQKASENNVKRVKFAIRPLSEITMDGRPHANFLLQYGFLDNSLLSTIVNLKKPIKDLWSNAKKRIKRAINAMRDKLIVKIYSWNNLTDADFESFQNMHFKASGRITRPQITWDMMRDWIYQKKALLLSAEMNRDEIGFALFILYKNGAYYASGANDPEKSDIPIAHTIFWEFIKWLKEHYYDYFEVGIYSYPSFNVIESNKEFQIAHFKRGFGGDEYPLFQGEKYYSWEFCQLQLQSRIDKYIQYLKNNENKLES